MAGGKIRSFIKSRQNITLALKVYETLSRQSQRKIKAIIPVYLGLAILDLIGVILLASCGTLAFNLVSGDSRPSRIELFIQKYISIDVDSETLIFLFAVSAGVFLISKTMIQALVNFRMIKWLANQESIFSINLFTSLLRAPLSEIQKINIGEAQWAIMIGSSRIVSGVVAPLVTVLGDIISILFLLITLLVATPEITLLLIVLLIVSQRSYSIWLRGRLKSYGLQSAEKAAALNQEIIQSFNAVKEIKIYSLIESISTYFIKEKNVVSLVGQKSSFLNNLFRYYLETIILLSAFFVVAFELYTSDTRRALTSLVLFISVGLRIIPSLQRLQAITMSLQLSYGMTKTYFDLTHKLNSIESEKVSNFQDTTLLRSDALGVELAGLDYSVKGEDEIISILRNIDLLIPAGKITVILGASGSGKTTLVDLIAGLLSPRNGSVNFIDGRGNTSAAQQNLVGYCTQNPYIFDFGVQENLKIAVGNYKDESVNSIIEELNLHELSESYRTKSEVSFSRRISGGERQRIGIARVFLSNRPILVFDEPTSALDKDNASRFLHLLNRHRGIRTQIVVSHDFEIASISDHLVVLDKGDIIYQGKPSDYLGNKQTK